MLYGKCDLILLFLLTLSSTVFAKIEKSENSQKAKLIKKTHTSVIVLSSLERLLQNEVVVEGTKEAEIFCARNEYESFQIIIVNREHNDLSKVDLQSSNWKYQGGNPIGVPVLKMFREHYLKIERSSGKANLPKGMYPDALIPFVNPYTGRRITKAKYRASGQDVKANSNQGYWIDILVGKDVSPGVYTNEITVFSADQEIGVVPIKVTVWNFELPKRHKLKTHFMRMPDVSMYHNISRHNHGYKVIEMRYRKLLRDYGVYLESQLLPQIDFDTGEAIFTNEFRKKLKDFTNEMEPPVTPLLWLFEFSKNPLKRAKYLSAWERFLNRNPWVPQPIVMIDEPKNKKDYLKVLDYGRTVKKYSPSIKFLVTEQIRPQSPDFPNLSEVVDIWCPVWYLANPNDIKKRQVLGDEVWSYCGLFHDKVPCWLIDAQLLDMRIPAWFSWSMNLKGILYWHSMAWARKELRIDPWIDSRTCRIGSSIWNGEASFVYPGNSAGIAGPVASMRLSVFRDSIEDYDYFCLLEALKGREVSENIVKRVASTFQNYSKDKTDYIETRKLIAQKILEAKK